MSKGKLVDAAVNATVQMWPLDEKLWYVLLSGVLFVFSSTKKKKKKKKIVFVDISQ